ncbi:MAG TPA: hypothetical protein VJM75_08760 [Acidimicrobiales bacterium]|nr:hypothetical protein [Acidimicrobiales bacterium]
MVTYIDWKRRRCFVEPTETPGRIRWQSTPLALRFQICRAMREVVLGSTPSVQLTRRAESALAEARTELAPVADSGGTVVVRDPAGDLRWWTWAGAGANATLHATLLDAVDPLQRVDNVSLRLRRDLTVPALRSAVTAAQDRPLAVPAVDDEALSGLKFSTALPRSIAVEALGARLADPHGAATVLRELLRRPTEFRTLAVHPSR